MGDNTPQNAMNLDLNLGPVIHPSTENEPRGLNLEDWLDGLVREAIGLRTMARQRWRSVWRPVPFPMETRTLALEFMSPSGPSGSEIGEGSMSAEVRQKKCENGDGYLEKDTLGEKKDETKSNEDEGGFFDCNICLDMASDPVVTCCGHLFCWPCLYKWLHIHSEAKECPICKGGITTKSVTPIYGRGNMPHVIEEDSSLMIPHRPQAKRVESRRQINSRNEFTMPMEEMIRRLGSRFDLTNNSLLNGYLSSRGLLTDQNPRSDAAVEPFQSVQEQEQAPSMEDRDSVSSVAAVIQSESQTVDTAVEIDSRVSVSTSSSRIRGESSRGSDVDSGDSRAPRRRRLH